MSDFELYEYSENKLKEAKKRIAELENYNKKLLEGDIDNHNKITLLSKKVNDLQKENNDLKTLVAEGDCLMDNCREMADKVAELEAQIEKMKRDVKTNIKWADQNGNNQMYCKLNAMINQWEIKE